MAVATESVAAARDPVEDLSRLDRVDRQRRGRRRRRADRDSVAARTDVDGSALRLCVQRLHAPAHRKQGLARRLMDAIHDYCRAEGIERVVLNASTFGKPLYDAMGYVVTDEPMMRLRLGDPRYS